MEQLTTFNEINQQLKNSINYLFSVFALSSDEGWGVSLDFDEVDAFKTTFIMSCVLSNISIKSKFITSPEEAKAIGDCIRDTLMNMFGIDFTNIDFNKIKEDSKIQILKDDE